MVTKQLQAWQTPRPCMVCGEDFIPYRKSQKFCPKPKRCVHTAKGRAIVHDETALLPTVCECGKSFTPWQTGQKRCGMDCPGKPEFIKTCAVAWCRKEFTCSPRVGNRQKYCSVTCSDQAETIWQHGLTTEQYSEMWEAQNGACAVCETNDEERGSKRSAQGRLHIDHDHECCPGQKSCGKCVRGLVCFKCNAMMGQANDDPNILIKAGSYLLQYQTEKARRSKEKAVFVIPEKENPRP